MIEASTVVKLGIPLMALVCAGLFLWAQWKVGRFAASAVGTVLWLGGTMGLAASGVLSNFDARPPPFLLLVISMVTMGTVLGASSVGGRLAQAVPLGALILAQGFRLPLELVMHQAAVEGVMPVEMSFSGYNFDIVTGATALVVGGLALSDKAPRALIWAWLGLSFATLIAVAVIAVASSPLVHAFGTEPAHLNTWVTHAPYVWLPAGPVVFGLAGQIIVLRKLLPATTRVSATALLA
jgi:hypothetical protein